LIVHTVYKILI